MNRTLLIALLSFVSCIAFAQKNEIFLQTIYSEIRIQEKNNFKYEENWTHECIPHEDLYPAIDRFLDALNENKFDTYEANRNRDGLANDLIGQRIPDTLEFHPGRYESYEEMMLDEYGEEMYNWETGEPITQFYYSEREAREIIGMGFIEHWYLDTVTHLIRKEINAMAPTIYHINETGDLTGTKPLLFIKPTEEQAQKVLTNRISTDLNFSKKPTDIWWDGTLEYSARHHLIEHILELANNPNARLFNFSHNRLTPLTDTSHAFNSVTYGPQLDDYGEYMYDWETGEELFQEHLDPLTYKNVTKVRFHERWKHDLSAGAFRKEIIGIELFSMHIDDRHWKHLIEEEVSNFYLALEDPSLSFPEEAFFCDQIDYALGIGHQSYTKDAKKWPIPIKMDTNLIKTWMIRFNEKIGTGELKAKRQEVLWADKYNRWITHDAEIREATHRIEIQQELDADGEPLYDMETGDAIEKVIYSKLKHRDFMRLSFSEEWNYDVSEHKFMKHINHIRPIVDRHETYAIPSQNFAEKHLQLAKNVITKTKINQLKYASDGFSETMNASPFNDTLEYSMHVTSQEALSPKQKHILWKNIVTDIHSGHLKAYKPESKKKYKSEELQELLTTQSAKPRLCDSAYHCFDLESETIIGKHLVAIEFKENWYLDTNTATITKTVNEVTFIAESDSLTYEKKEFLNKIGKHRCTHDNCYYGEISDENGDLIYNEEGEPTTCPKCLGEGYGYEAIIPYKANVPSVATREKKLFTLRFN